MPVRIRLSRGGVKKKPYYRIVVADSRRSRDGKFIDRIGTYNPMLQKDNPERVKIDLDKAKEWLSKGAKPSERVTLFLGEGISSPDAKQYIRPCSKKRPIMLFTLIFSDTLATPGFKQQTPRTINSIFTPNELAL